VSSAGELRGPWADGSPFARALNDAAAAWDARGGTRRLWERDASLWTGGEEERWLDWLDLDRAVHEAEAATALVHELRREDFSHVLLLGMGGSSLCPWALARIFGPTRDGLDVHVVDTTDPESILSVVDGRDLSRHLVIVASKSGGTLEPNLLKDLLFDRIAAAVGRGRAPSRFVAITDPGSSLDRAARAEGFRAVVNGVPGIGGRFSAISPFGLLPAALLGHDVRRLVARAKDMARRCHDGHATTNPGVSLGLALGTLAKSGQDKLTLVASRGSQPLGAWIEQLIAESTGKRGSGILPVDGESFAPESCYSGDRVFAWLRSEEDDGLPAWLSALERDGHPVIVLDVDKDGDVGAELFRWEVATAVAGSVLGIDAFDQPDVEASKVAARERLEGTTREPVAREMIAEDDDLRLWRAMDPADGGAFALPGPGPEAALAGLFASLRRGDYLAFLLWRASDSRLRRAAEGARTDVRNRRRCATTLGIGPRFLHSTGQYHKGGPNNGAFVQVMGPAGRDLAVPGREITFGQVETAQAEGDFDVLCRRGRRALMIELKTPVERSAPRLERLVRGALEMI
jgi:transaldolase/glucose-6-phosphate isomerase